MHIHFTATFFPSVFTVIRHKSNPFLVPSFSNCYRSIFIKLKAHCHFVFYCLLLIALDPNGSKRYGYAIVNEHHKDEYKKKCRNEEIKVHKLTTVDRWARISDKSPNTKQMLKRREREWEKTPRSYKPIRIRKENMVKQRATWRMYKGEKDTAILNKNTPNQFPTNGNLKVFKRNRSYREKRSLHSHSHTSNIHRDTIALKYDKHTVLIGFCHSENVNIKPHQRACHSDRCSTV